MTINTAVLKAVLWDMDGVIVDTFDGHYRAWQRMFKELEHPFTLEDFRRTFGMNNYNILKSLLPRSLTSEEVQEIGDRKEAYYRDFVRGNLSLLPGVENWLRLFAEKGILQAVGSSAPKANIDEHIDELGIRGWFTAQVSGEKLAGKPDPAVFLLAAERLGVEPVQCLVIEDGVAGVEAAKRAGMKCVAVLTTNPAEALAGADVVVKDLTHFTSEILENLFLAH